MTLSPLAPSSFPDLPKIVGINLATAASGTRYQGRDDLLLITLAPNSSVAGQRRRTAHGGGVFCRGRATRV